ncbi:hypothetical protein OAV62_01540, partial [bacterium]|nr:hypothetical protein [bacterium]
GILTQDANIRFDVFQKFLKECAEIEVSSLIEKFRTKDKYFPDPLMLKFFKEDKSVTSVKTPNMSSVSVNFGSYRQAYYEEHFPKDVTIEKICHEYLYGMQWIAHYYCKQIPSWTWFYPYHYAPFLCDLQKYCSTMKEVAYASTAPAEPFQQLLSVLPPQSSHLLPVALAKLTTQSTSPIIDYYPKNFEVDISGKRQEWEGIVKLPMIDTKRLERVYQSCKSTFTDSEKRRNKVQRNVMYVYESHRPFLFRSRYARIEKCHVHTTFL